MPQPLGTVLAGDKRLAVREWGPEDDPPVLFWHALGFPPSAATLD